MKSRQLKIRWGRVIVASLLSEVIPILILVLVVAVYSVFLTPSETLDETRLNNFAREAGNWIGPLVGSLMHLYFLFGRVANFQADIFCMAR